MTSPSQVQQLNQGPISAYSFNGDRSQVAICPNNEQVQIYNCSGENWTLDSTLTDHDKLVTSIDIAPRSNRIVTCSQDRNAYVWTYDGAQWKPTLVLIRINRAATTVKWSPNEDKFAVGSGARVICICYFDQDQDWWTSKHIKKPIRSTVLSVDWHPNNVLLAAGSADMKARVFSAFIKGVDKRPNATVWGDKIPFNTVCGEFTSPRGGWVHSVAFSPSGDALAFTGHDSSINIVYPAPGEPPAIVTITTSILPCLSLIWARETQIIAAGHDCAPILFESTGGQNWQFSGSLDQKKKKVSAGPTVFSRFRQMDLRGQTEKDSDLSTTHQNTITQIRTHAGASNNITQFSTAGVDGKLVIWDFGPSRAAGMMGGLRT